MHQTQRWTCWTMDCNSHHCQYFLLSSRKL